MQLSAPGTKRKRYWNVSEIETSGQYNHSCSETCVTRHSRQLPRTALLSWSSLSVELAKGSTA